jgi:hypothetical protein
MQIRGQDERRIGRAVMDDGGVVKHSDGDERRTGGQGCPTD